MGIMDSLLMRTGLKAKDGEKIIDGCGQCSHNIEKPGIMKIAPGHICRLEGEVIIDPFNIPRWCPIRIEEVQST